MADGTLPPWAYANIAYGVLRSIVRRIAENSLIAGGLINPFSRLPLSIPNPSAAQIEGLAREMHKGLEKALEEGIISPDVSVQFQVEIREHPSGDKTLDTAVIRFLVSSSNLDKLEITTRSFSPGDDTPKEQAVKRDTRIRVGPRSKP